MTFNPQAFAARVQAQVASRHGGDITAAAAEIGISPAALRRTLSGIEPGYGVGRAIADWCDGYSGGREERRGATLA